jgi:hypothetical protein
MLKRNLFDEAARVLAMPIPRRKAFKYVATGLAGALLSFLWPKRARADFDPPCGPNPCQSCTTDTPCQGKAVDAPCNPASGGSGHCAQVKLCTDIFRHKYACCTCIAGPPPDAPDMGAIPDVAITREASLAAGNCQEGTDWVASWFPGRHSVSAREAAAEAIARGKPRLARDIARTAHVIHRSAQA